MNKNSTRLKAEAFYIENIDATQAEVAEAFKVNKNTVSRWTKAHQWDEKRLDFHASPTKIKQLLQKELLAIAEGKDPTLPADAISKLMSTLDRLEKKADPVVVSRILKDLDNFIAKDDPKFAKQCVGYHKQFLQYRINLES